MSNSEGQRSSLNPPRDYIRPNVMVCVHHIYLRKQGFESRASRAVLSVASTGIVFNRTELYFGTI